MAAKKKQNPGQVVRRWESSPILYGFDSRYDRKENPDYHTPVSLTHKGLFVNDAGVVLDPKDVPDYVRVEAKKTNLDTTYHAPTRRELSMRDAMTAAGVDDTDPDPEARKKRGPAATIYA